ncbi:hypothetical protein tb265_36610 [Gemmatimonadetes bacterium T265]|nr:hypothetical protein tb265_36610 [Gemmatimonadetes bacterium T265]
MVEALRRYWFAPQPLSDLALLRIGLVVMLLVRLPALETALSVGADGPRLTGNVLPVLRAAMLPLGRLGHWDISVLGPLAWSTAVVAGLLAAIGLFARASVLVFLWALLVLWGAIYSRGDALYHNNALALISLGLLACAPCGAALSVDAWRARRAGRPVPPEHPDARWPLVTVQWLIALTYLSAAGSKLARGGLAWFAPSTLQFYLVQDGLRFGNPLALQAARVPALAAASALFSVAYEALFWLGLVWRRALPFLLLGGLVMHVGIFVLQRANFAEYAALALAFIDPVRRLRRRS